MQIELGTRVVRGLDWIWDDQDGEDGMLGTVIQIKCDVPGMASVKVLWDHGGQGVYRCGEGNACDLLVFCSPAVSKHGVGCDVCLKDVIGTRWSCKECPLTNLCTACYMNDKHNLQHGFERFDVSDKSGIALPTRAKSIKIEAKGCFPGAMVVRGLCWEWDDQDGGEGQVGKITEIQEFHSKYRRNVARVQWLGTAVSNVYRIGHNGKVDLKCIKYAPGGYFYKHHLQMLGTKTEGPPISMVNVQQQQPKSLVGAAATNFPMDSCTPGPSASVTPQEVASASAFASVIAAGTAATRVSLPSECNIAPEAKFQCENLNIVNKFQVLDRVRLTATKEQLMTLQAGHGGWNAAMESEIGQIGIVQSLTEKGDVTVTFDSNATWTVNNMALSKIHAPVFLKEGDSVKIMKDKDLAKKLFQSHVGEWSAEAAACLGQVGKITKVFLDGNMRISVGQTAVVLPQNLVAEQVEQLQTTNPTAAPDASQELKLIQAAKTGDMEEIKELLDAHPHDVNTPSLEGTPLVAAIFEEREDIVKYLIDKGADVNIIDKNKHTALHHALSVGNEELIKIVVNTDRIDMNILAGKSNLDYLQFAALCGSVVGTKELLKKSTSLMLRPSSGPTPLHYAVIASIELVTFLVNEGGYDSNVRDLDQRTPLHIAILTSNFAAAMFLVQAGADINACDYRGNTPLHMAISLQDRQSLREHVWYASVLKRYIGRRDQQRTETKEIVRQLVEDLELKKNWYVTDAVFACFLIKHGSNPMLKNTSGYNAFSTATRSEVLATVKRFYESLSKRAHIIPTKNCIPAEECSMNRNDNDLKANVKSSSNAYSSISSEDSSGMMECRLCRESNADACFEPCGHAVVCIDCAAYFCKCFVCELEIVSFSKKMAISDCLVCDETVADVLFEPCKHVVCCSSCAWRMARCIYCKSSIKQKLDKNLQPLAAPNDPDSAKYDDLLNSLKNLEAKVRDIENVNTCTICLDRQRNVMFLCGHGTCDICSPSLDMCPICRDPIEKKIPMF